MKNISERLVVAIRQSGHSKGALAAHIGVPQSSVSRWLAGSEPRSDRLIDIAKFLGVDVNWLLTGDEKKGVCYGDVKDLGAGKTTCVVREESPRETNDRGLREDVTVQLLERIALALEKIVEKLP